MNYLSVRDGSWMLRALDEPLTLDQLASIERRLGDARGPMARAIRSRINRQLERLCGSTENAEEMK